MRIIIKDISHWKIKRDALTISIMAFVAVILWIVIEVYQTYNQTIVDPEVEKYLEPLSPSIDLETLETLKNRYSPPEDFTIFVSDTDTESLTTFESESSFTSPLPASPSASQ